MSDPPIEPDPATDPELADVRGRMRAEFRAERRASELEAVRDHWSRRTMADVFVEAMRRGDTVTLEVWPTRRFTGTVTDVGRDFAILDGPYQQRVAVRVTDRDGHPYQGPELLLAIRERAQTGGTQATNPSATFRAVLQRFDFESQVDSRSLVEVGVTLRSQTLVGRVQALAEDHVYLVDEHGVDQFVPLSVITYVAWAQHSPA